MRGLMFALSPWRSGRFLFRFQIFMHFICPLCGVAIAYVRFVAPAARAVDARTEILKVVAIFVYNVGCIVRDGFQFMRGVA